MTPSQIKWILSTHYFLYFGILGIYLPYFNLYCYHLDFSGFQIGTLSALRTMATALFPLIWGALADRYNIRRPIFIFSVTASAAVWSLYLTTTDFWAMFAITACYGIFYAPIISFLESFSMDLLGGDKSNYGRLRVWGSISFIGFVMIVGRLIDMTSAGIILVLILAGSIIQSYMATKMPRTAPQQQARFTAGARALFNVRVLTFLFCAFLMLVSHGAYYGFFSIHLENLGYHSTFIGFAWALAAIAEIAVMFNSARILTRFSHENVLIVAFGITAARWLILSSVESAGMILFTQLFHAFSYGAFHVASILYIDKLTPPAAKTLGQAVNNAVTYGLGIMVGTFGSGYLFEKIGAGNLFFISGGLAMIGGLLLIIEKFFRRQPAAP